MNTLKWRKDRKSHPNRGGKTVASPLVSVGKFIEYEVELHCKSNPLHQQQDQMKFKLDPTTPPNEDDYYLGVALAVRRKANCTGNRVAAVIVKNKRVIATGYNGVPEDMTNCLDGGCLRCSNPNGQFKSGTRYDLCICVHAEQNALLSAARFGISVEGANLYTTMQPCFGCAKEILQAKIAQVFYLHSWIPTDVDPAMDAAMKGEYAKIIAKLKIKKLKFDDPVAPWAVTTMRQAAKTSTNKPLPKTAKKKTSKKKSKASSK